uniref:Putative ovule protein n=1 Tax=Solanum chacoense TaxID=4108 RepID=A0A0V0HYU8_SOLCH
MVDISDLARPKLLRGRSPYLLHVHLVNLFIQLPTRTSFDHPIHYLPPTTKTFFNFNVYFFSRLY